MEFRSRIVGPQKPFDTPHDEIVVLRVHHRDHAEVARFFEHVEHLTIVEPNGVVRHEDLDRGMTLGDESGKLVVEDGRCGIGNDQVEAVVDHGLAVCFPSIRLHRL